MIFRRFSNLEFRRPFIRHFHFLKNFFSTRRPSLVSYYTRFVCPASIFYSSLYSESIYQTFTFLGLLLIYSPTTNISSRLNLLFASAVFSLAFLTRSNGLTNIGFIGFPLLLDVIIFIERQIPNENGEGERGGMIDKNGGIYQQKYQQFEFREFSVELVKKVYFLI
ncbi:unnamed protein product [Meloidogyne enterolobii]|uniref:Uncharacterized protein n=1 Tax=Meloidogyne enterolobii TaxID=390850 RepID=A0ACB0YC96_MELEN